jgi:hypothetical protein
MVGGRARAGVAVVLALLAGVPGGVRASEESELLVAKGQVAYHRGRDEEARGLLERAVAADGEDAEARYMLGLVLTRLGLFDQAISELERAVMLEPASRASQHALEVARAKAAGLPAPPAPALEEVAPIDEAVRARRPELFKRWEVHAATGLLYDDNVKLTNSKRDDGAGFLSAGGRLDALSRENALLRLEYDLFNRWYFDIDEFDFQSHNLRGTGSYGITPRVWVGVQGGAEFFRLDEQGFLNEPFVLPFVSYNWGGAGLSQVTYRYGNGTYLSAPFEDIRDGSTHNVAASHTLYWIRGRYLTLGWAYGREDPSEEFDQGRNGCKIPSGGTQLVCPGDFQAHFNEVSVAFGFEAWWKIVVDLMYYYRYYDYERPNSLAEPAFSRRRHDNEHQIFAQILRPITKNFRVAVRYFGTINPSNIEVYDYRRNLVTGVLEVVY